MALIIPSYPTLTKTLIKLFRTKIFESERPSDYFKYHVYHLYDNGSHDIKNCVGMIGCKSENSKKLFVKYLKNNNWGEIELLLKEKRIIKLK